MNQDQKKTKQQKYAAQINYQ